MSSLQTIVIMIAVFEIGFGVYWLLRVAPRFGQQKDQHSEYQRLRQQGGLIERRGLLDSLMINDPHARDHDQPRRVFNPQAIVGLAMILGGIMVAVVALLFLGDGG